MGIIQPNFFKMQFKNIQNNNPKKNISLAKTNNFKNISQSIPSNFYKANYMINFKGGMEYEKSQDSGIGTLNHQTVFFREPETDEIIQNYILEKFGNNEKINIVSGACSTGEEAKSYAMMLDFMKDKINISGFDISPKVIKYAKSNNCQLIKAIGDSISNVELLDSETILLDDDVELSEYLQKCKNKFRRYYTQKGPQHKISIFPEAKKAIEDIEAILNDEEEFNKQKELYEQTMDEAKKIAPKLIRYTPETNFKEAIEINKQLLEEQAASYRKVVDFEINDKNSFDNCTFIEGNILNLEELYEPNSINVLLYRNALYHTLCTGNGMLRMLKPDSKKIINGIAEQMNKIVKPQGLVVFGENEYNQGIDNALIKKAMENNGFKPYKNNDHIWIKV